MSRPFAIQLPVEEAYSRRVLFAIELLDAVTLSRVSEGVKVVADGLLGKPIVNSSGLFVWLEEDIKKLRMVSINPGNLPYEELELDPAKLNLPPVKPPFSTVELQPKVGYSFASGITGLRGMLIEEIDGTPPSQHPMSSWLAEAGFVSGAMGFQATFRRVGAGGGAG